MSPRSFLRGLLVKTASPHFPEHALALHLLLEHAERLLDVVIADKYLQKVAPHVRLRKRGESIVSSAESKNLIAYILSLKKKK